jgi:hypothetical protein
VHKTLGNKQQERQSNKEEMQDQHHQAIVTLQLWNCIGGAKNSNELYLFYMRLILFPVKF